MNPREFYNRNGQMYSKIHTKTSRPKIIKLFFRIKTLEKSLSVMLIPNKSRQNGIGTGKRMDQWNRTQKIDLMCINMFHWSLPTCKINEVSSFLKGFVFILCTLVFFSVDMYYTMCILGAHTTKARRGCQMHWNWS